MENIVQNFLSFARPSESKLERANIADFLDDIHSMTLPEMGTRGVSLHMGCNAEAEARIDQEQLKQVLLNLVRNAAEASLFEVLHSLHRSGAKYFLGGGQAVNYWAFNLRGRFKESLGLEKFDPFTSKDCDVYVTVGAAKFFRKAGGNYLQSRSPADGQFAIYRLPEDPSLQVDLMTSIFGTPMHSISKALDRCQNISGICVLDPIYLLKAKCHNLEGGRQDRKHVGMMACVVPAYFRLLGEELASERLTERQVIKELKFLITNCTKDTVVARTFAAENITLASLIPSEVLSSQRHSTLQCFLESLSL